MNIVGLLIQIVIGMIVSAPALWIVGKWRVGPEKAKFTDALWISALGTIVNVVIGSLNGGGIGSIIQFVIYLYLIKKYYETDWINSLIISIVATVLVLVVLTVVAIVGIAILN